MEVDPDPPYAADQKFSKSENPGRSEIPDPPYANYPPCTDARLRVPCVLGKYRNHFSRTRPASGILLAHQKDSCAQDNLLTTQIELRGCILALTCVSLRKRLRDGSFLAAPCDSWRLEENVTSGNQPPGQR